MRRILLVSACLGVLVFSGTATALAYGPQHRPPAARGGFGGYGGHGHSPYGGWHTQYRGSYGQHCVPRRVAAYPAYPGYGVPAYGSAYPQLGFGAAGRNFSFWLQR
ncbi:MAG: hypothetical protein WDZ48_09425 [Pirellulales bacterium]